MTATPDPEILAAAPGASARGGQEPFWALAYAAADLQRLPRGAVATVDLNDPAVRRKLQSGLLSLLPADEQPRIETGPDGLPRLVEEVPDEFETERGGIGS
jgi:hypothetical protein